MNVFEFTECKGIIEITNTKKRQFQNFDRQTLTSPTPTHQWSFHTIHKDPPHCVLSAPFPGGCCFTITLPRTSNSGHPRTRPHSMLRRKYLATPSILDVITAERTRARNSSLRIVTEWAAVGFHQHNPNGGDGGCTYHITSFQAHIIYRAPKRLVPQEYGEGQL